MPEDLNEIGVSKEKWPIVFIVDTSDSMAGERLVRLNNALKEISGILETLAEQNDVQLSIRLIEFNTTASWRIGNLESDVKHLNIYFSETNGQINTSEALNLAKSVLRIQYLGSRSLKPLLLLFASDYSINPQATANAIEELNTSALGRRNKILRMALTIGDEAFSELTAFVSQINDKSLVFTVDDLGNIQDTDLLISSITSFCFSYTRYPVLPYDDEVQIQPSPDWEEWDDEDIL